MKKVDLPEAIIEAHIIDDLNQRPAKQEQSGLTMPTYHDFEPSHENPPPDDCQLVIIIEL